MRFSLVVVVFLMGIVPACAGCGGGNGGNKRGCTLDDGTFLNVGESGQVDCNQCVCATNLKLACTQRACDDAGPSDGEGAGSEGEGVAEGEGEGVDEGPCHDRDHDGFYDCIDLSHTERSDQIDCDDERFHVQPGGVEFPDTPEDDNCDGHNDDFDSCSCDGSAQNAADLGAGMDLCGDVVTAVSKNGSAQQFGIVDSYRNVIGPRQRARQDDPNAPPVILGNQCLTTLSTGDATGAGESVEFSCSFNDPDPAAGNNDDIICDLAQIHFTLQVPANAQGFAFDFMFLSQEWPEYLCLVYNDTFYAIVDDDTAINPEGSAVNAAFDSTNRPITVNVGFFENPSAWTQSLDGTTFGENDFQSCPSPGDELYEPGCNLPSYCGDSGLDVRKGSGSGWLTTSVPVTPGQPVSLTLSIHDENDGLFDSLVLLDSFRWLPFEPTLETAKEER